MTENAVLLIVCLLVVADVAIWRHAVIRTKHSMPAWAALPGAMLVAAGYWFFIKRRKYE